MTLLWLLNRLLLAGAIAIVATLWIWASAMEEQAATASHLQYCSDVAQWQYEERIGIHPTQRTGHPDFEGIAAEHCPGLRPAELARN